MAHEEAAVAPGWAVLRARSAENPIGHVLLTLIAEKEEEYYISECPELGVISFGETLIDAFDAVMDATIVHLNTLERLGERERVFKKSKLKLTPGAPVENEKRTVSAKPGEIITAMSVGLVVMVLSATQEAANHEPRTDGHPNCAPGDQEIGPPMARRERGGQRIHHRGLRLDRG